MHTDKCWYKTRGGFIKMRNSGSRVPGASVRNSARGKGHEEGGSAYAKAGSSLRSSPGNSRASTPKTRHRYKANPTAIRNHKLLLHFNAH